MNPVSVTGARGWPVFQSASSSAPAAMKLAANSSRVASGEWPLDSSMKPPTAMRGVGIMGAPPRDHAIIHDPPPASPPRGAAGIGRHARARPDPRHEARAQHARPALLRRLPHKLLDG